MTAVAEVIEIEAAAPPVDNTAPVAAGVLDVSAQMAYLEMMRKLACVIKALHRCAELDARVIEVAIDSKPDSRARIVIDPPGDGTPLAELFEVHGKCTPFERDVMFAFQHEGVVVEWRL